MASWIDAAASMALDSSATASSPFVNNANFSLGALTVGGASGIGPGSGPQVDAGATAATAKDGSSANAGGGSSGTAGTGSNALLWIAILGIAVTLILALRKKG